MTAVEVAEFLHEHREQIERTFMEQQRVQVKELAVHVRSAAGLLAMEGQLLAANSHIRDAVTDVIEALVLLGSKGS
jgi:hypothetical protein